MSRRKYSIIIAACLLLSVVVIWVLLPAAPPRTDEDRFLRWQQTVKLFGRTYWWERHLPQSICQMLRLPKLYYSYVDEHAKLTDALLSSRYFTNVYVTVDVPPTNWAQRAEVSKRLGEAFQHQVEWEFEVRSNTIIVTCRPQNAELCKRAIQD
jgi:hypothetical protein